MAPRTFATKAHERRSKPLEQFQLFGERMTPANADDVAATGAEPVYEPWEETFTVRAVLPGGLIADLVTAVGVDGEGNLTYGRSAVLKFMRSAVIDDDQARFDALMRDTDRVVELDDVGPVMLWIVGMNNGGRPTGPLSS